MHEAEKSCTCTKLKKAAFVVVGHRDRSLSNILTTLRTAPPEIMKLFNIFSRSKSKEIEHGTPKMTNPDTSTISSSTAADASIGSSKKKRSSKKQGKARKSTTGQSDAKPMSELCKIAEDCVLAWNNYQPDNPELYSERLMQFYQKEDTPIILEDGERYKPEQCNQMFDITFRSFPDFKFSYGKIEEIKPNQVTVEGLHATGTHTGAPYTIMPGTLPAVDPSGKTISNDEQLLIFHFDENQKIKKLEVIAIGSYTGFVGFYTRAGGDLSALQQ